MWVLPHLNLLVQSACFITFLLEFIFPLPCFPAPFLTWPESCNFVYLNSCGVHIFADILLSLCQKFLKKSDCSIYVFKAPYREMKSIPCIQRSFPNVYLGIGSKQKKGRIELNVFVTNILCSLCSAPFHSIGLCVIKAPDQAFDCPHHPSFPDPDPPLVLIVVKTCD